MTEGAPQRPVCLVVGSSDSSGGAGIQADVRALAAVGCFCSTAIVGISAQAPTGLRRYWPSSAGAIREQVRAAIESFSISAVKIGSLSLSLSAASGLAETIHRLGAPVVLDPVIVTAAGSFLCDPERLDVLDVLLPVASVATPNLREAEIIAASPPGARSSRRSLAEAVVSRGARAVVITGGEAADGADWLFLDGRHHRIPPPAGLGRVRRGDTVHGAGCTHSATLCGLLARGWDLLAAARAAKWQATRAAVEGLRSLDGVQVAEARPVDERTFGREGHGG